VVAVTDEDEYFPPPRELRELLGALDVAVRATLAAPGPAPATFADDRDVAASDVLDAIAR
jgi:4-hydroxy-3-methylbut-2-enyl diphosphate reductase